jgi:hypothetical protein
MCPQGLDTSDQQTKRVWFFCREYVGDTDSFGRSILIERDLVDLTEKATEVDGTLTINSIGFDPTTNLVLFTTHMPLPSVFGPSAFRARGGLNERVGGISGSRSFRFGTTNDDAFSITGQSLSYLGVGGNDQIRTSGGFKDFVAGGDGDDTISLGDSNDVLVGGLGGDRLEGGTGDDKFVYGSVEESRPGGADLIRDFQPGDSIVLSPIDAKVGVAGNQAFDFIGMRSFSGRPGELAISNRNSLLLWTFVLGDVDGDRKADLVIRLPGGTPLRARDFRL